VPSGEDQGNGPADRNPVERHIAQIKDIQEAFESNPKLILARRSLARYGTSS
jgi:hypothetical protein